MNLIHFGVVEWLGLPFLDLLDDLRGFLSLSKVDEVSNIVRGAILNERQRCEV